MIIYSKIPDEYYCGYQAAIPIVMSSDDTLSSSDNADDVLFVYYDRGVFKKLVLFGPMADFCTEFDGNAFLSNVEDNLAIIVYLMKSSSTAVLFKLKFYTDDMNIWAHPDQIMETKNELQKPSVTIHYTGNNDIVINRNTFYLSGQRTTKHTFSGYIIDWISLNIHSRVYIKTVNNHTLTFYFDHHEDAVLFKLKWG